MKAVLKCSKGYPLIFFRSVLGVQKCANQDSNRRNQGFFHLFGFVFANLLQIIANFAIRVSFGF